MSSWTLLNLWNSRWLFRDKCRVVQDCQWDTCWLGWDFPAATFKSGHAIVFYLGINISVLMWEIFKIIPHYCLRCLYMLYCPLFGSVLKRFFSPFFSWIISKQQIISVYWTVLCCAVLCCTVLYCTKGCKVVH